MIGKEINCFSFNGICNMLWQLHRIHMQSVKSWSCKQTGWERKKCSNIFHGLIFHSVCQPINVRLFWFQVKEFQQESCIKQELNDGFVFIGCYGALRSTHNSLQLLMNIVIDSQVKKLRLVSGIFIVLHL